MKIPKKLLEKIESGLLPTEILNGEDLAKKKYQKIASVLLSIVMREEPCVILTQRPETMTEHPGQIAFPGGKRENNENALETVLRETKEEIGLLPRDITVIGRLPSFDSVSNYRVTPFVGIVEPNAKFIIEPSEVDDIFEVPLEFLMNSDNHVARSVKYKGKTLTIYDMPYKSVDGVYRNIWGMTAMIIYRLYQRSFLSVFEIDY